MGARYCPEWNGEFDKVLRKDYHTAAPLEKVTSAVLPIIIDYLKRHDGKAPRDIKKPINSQHLKELLLENGMKLGDVEKADVELMESLPKEAIFEVILAANYMDIRPLLHLGCAKIATLIKGKSPEEIKKILGESDAAGDAQNKAKESGMTVNSRRRLAELMGLQDLMDN